MRVTQENGRTWYEANGRTACVSSCVRGNRCGYMVHANWTSDGKNWVGGYGECVPVSLAEATDMAKRFVSGQPVPEELGGFDDNKPEEVVSE